MTSIKQPQNKAQLHVYDYINNPKTRPKLQSKQGSFGFHVGVSKNDGTPKSSILIGFSIIPYFWKDPCIHKISHYPALGMNDEFVFAKFFAR